jgi:hypothetical protein
MDNFQNRYGTWALVAGAAEGLGEAYSRALARKGMSLLMVDNKPDPLARLAISLEKEYSIQTKQLVTDLRQGDAPSMIMEEVKMEDCRLLIYNAAYSRVKPFLDVDEAELDLFIDINCRTPIKLVHLFANFLKIKSSGGILLMSSLSGLIGMQLVAPYAATKAFNWNLSEGLHHEFRKYNIDIMACIAGATATQAYLDTKPEYGFFKPSVMKPDDLADGALKALGRKTLFIPGFSNSISYFILLRLLPRRWASSIANKTMRKMYGSKL